MTVRVSLLGVGSLMVCLAALPGCGKLVADAAPEAAPSTKQVGGVGVVDLDSVAKQLGRDQEMSKSVKARMARLNKKLTSLQDSLNRLYEEKRASFGSEADEEQEKVLLGMQERMDIQLRDSRRTAENDLANYRQSLIEQFREQAKPVLRDVAAARGLSIVVPKNDGLLLTIDPSVEITDEVARKMLASQPKGAAEAGDDTEEEATETTLR